MNKNFKNTVVAIVFLAGITIMSSCNRGGYGCPYELKIPSVCILK